MPNVGLEDESPSSKSEGSPEEERTSVEERETATPVVADTAVTIPQPEVTEVQRSPRHQTFTNGERRRRKLPEIPKNRKCKYILHF